MADFRPCPDLCSSPNARLERQPEPPERAELGIAVGPVVVGRVTVSDRFGFMLP